MIETLLHHPKAPLYALCAVGWLLLFICAFLCLSADPQRSAAAPKRGASDGGREDGFETFAGGDRRVKAVFPEA
jgi:hypothetical protein